MSAMEEALAKLAEASGIYAVESRLALVMLRAAAADGEISDDEYLQMSDVLGSLLEDLGIENVDTAAVLHDGFKDIYEQELLLESIAILGEHLPADVLGDIWERVLAISGTDGLDSEEEDFMNALGGAWNIEG